MEVMPLRTDSEFFLQSVAKLGNSDFSILISIIGLVGSNKIIWMVVDFSLHFSAQFRGEKISLRIRVSALKLLHSPSISKLSEQLPVTRLAKRWIAT
jgi:hypothetical protein